MTRIEGKQALSELSSGSELRNVQISYTPEFVDIVCQQGQIVMKCCRGDDQIVGTNQLSSAYQLGVKSSV